MVWGPVASPRQHALPTSGQGADRETAAASWSCVPWSPDPHCRLDRAGHTATAVGSSIYVAFGSAGSTFFTDVLVFDTTTNRVSRPVSKLPGGVRARSNHTATLVGSRIWFIAGNDTEDVFGDVITLDTVSHTWAMERVNDPHNLLMRTAHAAEVHPRCPHNILVMGGYGPSDAGDSGDFDMHNDLVMLDTQNCSTERLIALHGCVPPTPRAWHTMNAVGDWLVIFGGRNANGVVDAADGSQLVVYDVWQNRWLRPAVGGTPPSSRSSHRTAVVGGRSIVLYGGATVGGDLRKERTTDLFSLRVQPDGQLVWSALDTPQQGDQLPQARSAHTMTLVGHTAYVICGYNGNKSARDRHVCDCWALRLVPEALQAAGGGTPKAAAASSAAQPAAQAATPSKLAQAAVGGAGGGGGGRGGRRPRAAAAPAGASGAPQDAAAGAGDVDNGDAAGDAGMDASAWRTAKRQRSAPGGNGRQQQQPPASPQPAAPPQQPPPQQRQPQPQQQPPQQQLQQPQQLQQQPQPQQPYLQVPGTEQMAAAMAAAVQVMASPLRTGSPLHDSFSMGGYLQQQQLQVEVDNLKTQLQDQKQARVGLETQLAMLQQQLVEAKAEAQGEKQRAEQKLQELWAHKSEAQRERDHAASLLAEKQRLEKAAAVAETNLTSAQQQVQVLREDTSRLRQQGSETHKELQATKKALQQQEAAARRAQDAAAAELQQAQEAAAQTQALVEQLRAELSRANDAVAAQKQQAAAAQQAHQQQQAEHAAQLRDRDDQLRALQQALQQAKAAAEDAQKQRDDAVKLQVATRDQLNELNTNHKALLQEKHALASEADKLRDEAERLRSTLQQHKCGSRTVHSAFSQLQAQLQTAMQSMAGSLAQLPQSQ